MKALLFVLGLFCCGLSYAQESITEENYLRLDSVLWNNFENYNDSLSICYKMMPDKKDSIQRLYDESYERVSKENIELAKRFVSVPSGLRRIFMNRLNIPKDTLGCILSRLTPDMQQSFYGKNIKDHIDTKQIEEGDFAYYYPCVQPDGKPFDWEATKGKQLLIIYEGLSCMGESGRNYLRELSKKTSRDNFLIIAYSLSSDLEELQKVSTQYGLNLLFVSDFKGDATPAKIKYGTQSMPVCFLTDKQHKVVMKTTGLNSERIEKYLFN